MNSLNCGSVLSDPKSGSRLCTLLVAASLLFSIYFIGSASVAKEYKEKLFRWGAVNTEHNLSKGDSDLLQNTEHNLSKGDSDVLQNTKLCNCNGTLQSTMTNTSKEVVTSKNTKSVGCENRCRRSGSEALPEGIVSKTSNLEMRPLWNSTVENVWHGRNSEPLKSLLAIAVGIRQKEIVNEIVTKFLLCDFAVMLFHYDGVVDEWRDLDWSDRAIHVSAVNQTKWWFAKRFLHPDIVAEYSYIFLWDEDLGVENFHPERYLSIVKDEGLEISQPALDPSKSDVHHPITARRKNSRVHRRFYKLKGQGRCDDSSVDPPCMGWVEMMAPVFSRAAWRCAWYMVQNDLIHAWGLDMQLGYCAQGDRTETVGVVDSEYIVHLGLPTLGVSDRNKLIDHEHAHPVKGHSFSDSKEAPAPLEFNRRFDNRPEVRWQSYVEMQIFRKRWKNAVREDKCWVDPYNKPANRTIH